jgi:hypothetical protein
MKENKPDPLTAAILEGRVKIGRIEEATETDYSIMQDGDQITISSDKLSLTARTSNMMSALKAGSSFTDMDGNIWSIKLDGPQFIISSDAGSFAVDRVDIASILK